MKEYFEMVTPQFFLGGMVVLAILAGIAFLIFVLSPNSKPNEPRS